MNFNKLPIEIIEKIFYIHVYENLGSKRTLLRTCRTWYNVASNYAMLWRAIHWSPHNPVTTVHPSDQCLNLNNLAQDIGRTGTVTFDLVLECTLISPSNIDQSGFAVKMNPNWLSRCRSLRLYAPRDPFGISVRSTVNDILSPNYHTFQALEHLSINDMGTRAWGFALDTLIRKIAKSSPKLQSLELAIIAEQYNTVPQVLRHPDILCRIRRLQLTTIAVRVPWTEFTNLEHLDCTLKNVANRINLPELVAPRLASLCLDGNFQHTKPPTPALFNQLTHMVLRSFRCWTDCTSYLSSFSRLSSLGIQSPCNRRMFKYIKTESPLEELVLATYSNIVTYPSFSDSKLQPRVLRLDIVPEEPSHCGFSEPISLWSRVEELHVTVRKDERMAMGQQLFWALSELSRNTPVTSQDPLAETYPLLRILTVLCPHSDQGPGEKQERVDELRDMQRGRRESGFRLLETVKTGWYRPCDYLLGVPYAERRVMEWKDCLEGWTP